MPKIVDEQMRAATRQRAFAHLAEEKSDNFNVYMSALYGVNRAFRAEATKLLRDYVAVIALMLEQSQARDPLPACRGHRLDGAVADRVVGPLRQGTWTILARDCPAGGAGR